MDPNGVMAPAVHELPWKTLALTADGLKTNLAMIGQIEMRMRATREAGQEDKLVASLLHLRCFAHAGVLATKPLIESVSGLPSFLVRLGHILQSARSFEKFKASLEKVISQAWELPGGGYKRVSVYPPEYAEWRRRAQRILQLSRIDRRLSEDDENMLLAMLNGSWESEAVTHYCLRGTCKCTSGAEAKSRVANLITMLILGGGPGVPLLYRWKAFPESLAWAFRAASLCRLLIRALEGVYGKTDMAENERRVQAAAANGEEDFAAKAAVRGKKVLIYVRQRDLHFRFLMGLTANIPLQIYLDKIFACERDATLYREAMRAWSPGAPPVDPALRNAVLRRNLEFLKGTAATALTRQFTVMITDYSADIWKTMDTERPGLFKAATEFVKGVGIAWRRTTLYTELPRIRLLAACDIPTEACTHELICGKLHGLKEMHSECSMCIDDSFTGIWLPRLLNAESWKAAYDAVRHIIASLILTSSRVERKHIIGEDTPRRAAA